jgi:anti-sigma regulatory factor (Ser/Thr protein kinase)
MEMISSHSTMAVVEASQPSAARFLAQELAETAGFGADDVHRAGIVATELATNLVKHAKGGQILARVTAGAPEAEVELISIDHGPGMRDVTTCLADGHSTAGSSGNGLGAIRRLANTFDIFSEEGRGTVVMARLRATRGAPPPRHALTVAGVSIPMDGEHVCGDAWSVRHEVDGATAILADGLGHGLHASEAARAAVVAFRAGRYRDGVESLQAVHDGIRHTRGAAAAIAEIRPDLRVLRYAGVGNISTAVHQNGVVRQAVSHNGTLGHQARVIREYSYPWATDALFVMHSDGLTTRWSLDDYRGLRQRHPAIVAAVLYRDHSRGRDDVTVLVGREEAA